MLYNEWLARPCDRGSACGGWRRHAAAAPTEAQYVQQKACGPLLSAAPSYPAAPGWLPDHSRPATRSQTGSVLGIWVIKGTEAQSEV